MEDEVVPYATTTGLISLPEKDFNMLIKKLFEEFDSIGISQASTTCLPQNDDGNHNVKLAKASFQLVNMYRKQLNQIKEMNFINMQLKSDNIRLHNQINEQEITVIKKNNVIESLDKKLTLLKLDCEDHLKDRASLQQQLGCMQRLVRSKESQWEQKLKQVEIENNTLKINNSFDKAKGSDENLAGVFLKYQINEMNYKDTIRKLQDSNQGLVRQLVGLLNDNYTKVKSNEEDSTTVAVKELN